MSKRQELREKREKRNTLAMVQSRKIQRGSEEAVVSPDGSIIAILKWRR